MLERYVDEGRPAMPPPRPPRIKSSAASEEADESQPPLV
jgi:hypothetical protein